MRLLCCVLALLAAGAGAISAQEPPTRTPLDRLPAEVLDVVPPSARVSGSPGQMTIGETGCRTFPAAEVRRRIVDVAIQEWAYFGFAIVDQSDDEESDEPGPARSWRRRRGGPEAARVADSIAGYWAVSPGGAWILESQNTFWSSPGNASGRWRYPWSAAFVSWVMCESGLSTSRQFQRAIAHHTYIDQAIRSGDGAAFTAHEPGDADIAPGDLLCTARRPEYRTLADRRRQMGEGARTHCDIVVKVDEAGARILAIGGNVRGTVGLKVLPAELEGKRLRVAAPAAEGRGRPIFAHLKLDAAYAGVDANAFDASPTLQALASQAPGFMMSLGVPLLD